MEHAELTECFDLGAAGINAVKAREILTLKFPGRLYCTKLLCRVLAKGHDRHFGNDVDGMTMFLAEGERVRSNGGVFELGFTTDARISDVYVMTCSMRQHAAVYGDVVINDGMHGMDWYGSVTMPNTLIVTAMDCRTGFGDLDASLLAHVREAIFLDFKTSRGLDEHFSRMSILFGHVPRAEFFVKKLTADRLLVCKTHTTRVFSCGASSTQRGEGANSRLKGN
ncbi:hypothetical protein H257_16197 [Aphanomyces astaci]|uniref:Uncharacterized protein n=1 Tax=Aphanomyces astaci TaxID=112090 RepID=W4FLQ0_APHAT|nr:hypothetical protein H257_16197 [Aphanomyces astaci]ETV67598.1 hypothetical protein H257_16197 [Aphanomyces astaci]|eukprot:XP_009842855.1 hypothetical protein H257_16197 [Aphanomyces astaci]